MREQNNSISIIVPCRNESGNVNKLAEEIFRILKTSDEIIFVEGGSTDDTWDQLCKIKNTHADKVQAVKQDGKGKFDAVIKGASISKSNTIMIWDADATVNFDQNQIIYEFVNTEELLITGDRLRGTIEKGAMRPFNFIGNWMFSIMWVLILHKKPIDLLCGSKRFPLSLLQTTPQWLQEIDPFGDFTIFIMAKLNDLEIKSIPVVYHARSYGKTNIHRWSSGIKLLQITVVIFFKTFSNSFKYTKSN